MRHESIYIDSRDAPEKRSKFCDDGVEHHFTEAAIMIAFAMYLFDEGASEVTIHPDGEHVKRHDLLQTLHAKGFVMVSSTGSTNYGGCYKRDLHLLTVSPRPGLGDVTALLNEKQVVAECKGGITNTKHAGQTSHLRKGLCEVIGQLMSRDPGHERHIAVVPDTLTTRSLATKMRSRAARAGIEIALVTATGNVHF
ncbi:hypothetical protein [Granulicella mallensis]|uniref:Uncharacterized protein n=1 Tax=Granulicella mallensis TaxID=940614 RepID=A0A7W7ZQU3_9BACT|nr:hypothetical protein [Granulicella mallensis]MBB5064109.1 hypothetical protein [Granulicella mallensis]